MITPFEGRRPDWWHGLFAIAALALVACIVRAWMNGAVISAGTALVAIGIWMDHRTSLRERLALGPPRWDPSQAGLACIAAGLLVVCFGSARVLLE